MASSKNCCVPGCNVSRDTGHSLHGFPNPELDRERFNTWLYAIGGDIIGLKTAIIYKYRRVCLRHFETKYLCRNNRLSKIATPTLNMPGVSLPSTSASATITTAPTETTNAPLPPTELPSITKQSPTEPTETLDEELLILGEDPLKIKSFGEDIQQDLAIRLQHISTSGLPKEIRKDLIYKYLLPANCTLIDAPTLNPEVIAAVPEAVFKRDKKIELRQKQRAAAIACIAKGLTLVMSSEPRNTPLVQILMDSMKLLCDSQNTDSVKRRNFVLNTIKKDFKDRLRKTKIDKLLFSENLAEKQLKLYQNMEQT